MIEGKEYKLKKAIITPEETIPAGTVFDFFEGIVRSDHYGYRVVKELVKDFDEWFEEVSGRWRAELYGIYFTFGYQGKIITRIDRYDDNDNYNWETGNYAKTEGELDSYKSYLLAKQRLKDSTDGFKPKPADLSYTVESSEGKLYVVHHWYIPGGVFFKTREGAEKSLEEYRGDWEFVMDYETGSL